MGAGRSFPAARGRPGRAGGPGSEVEPPALLGRGSHEGADLGRRAGRRGHELLVARPGARRTGRRDRGGTRRPRSGRSRRRPGGPGDGLLEQVGVHRARPRAAGRTRRSRSASSASSGTEDGCVGPCLVDLGPDGVRTERPREGRRRRRPLRGQGRAGLGRVAHASDLHVVGCPTSGVDTPDSICIGRLPDRPLSVYRSSRCGAASGGPGPAPGPVLR